MRFMVCIEIALRIELCELNEPFFYPTVPHQNLAIFLIKKACQNSKLASYLFWYLSIECEDQESSRKQNVRMREMYVTVQAALMKTLSSGKLINYYYLSNIKCIFIIIIF